MTDSLAPLLDLPGVADAVDRARVACEELRWHEAYRRRWREVRAEAGLRATRASCEVEGVRVPLSLVRSLATAGGSEPVVVGALRATALVERWMPALGDRGAVALPPLGQLLAQVHVAATGGWLPDESRRPVAVDRAARRPARARARARRRRAGRPRRAARPDRARRRARPRSSSRPSCTASCSPCGRSPPRTGWWPARSARLLLTARGLDPTGSVVTESAWAAALNPYLGAAAGFATGSPAGVARLDRACADAVVGGCGRGARRSRTGCWPARWGRRAPRRAVASARRRGRWRPAPASSAARRTTAPRGRRRQQPTGR